MSDIEQNEALAYNVQKRIRYIRTLFYPNSVWWNQILHILSRSIKFDVMEVL